MWDNLPSDVNVFATMQTHFWFHQLFALILKEFRQIWRDPSSWLVAFVIPLTFLLIFGYGIRLDAGILPVATLNHSGGRDSLSLISDFAHSPWFRVHPVRAMEEAATQMRDSQIQGVVVIREDFDSQISAGRAGDLQIIVDGSEPNSAQYIMSYAQGVVASWQGAPQGAPILLAPRIWYNPDARSQAFLVPGSITVIMTLIGTLLTSLVIAREWERGTMETLIATPVSSLQILLGKLVPYFCMGMVSMALCVAASVVLFAIPFRGSIQALLLISSIFMLSALGQGLLISVALKNQLLAAEAGLFTGFLPALLLSGFVFDISSMPEILQLFTRILPATYFNTCIRTLFLAGDYWNIFVPSLLYMAILAMALLTLVYLKIPRRLPKA